LLRFTEAVGEDSLRLAWEKLAEHHDALRMVCRTQAGKEELRVRAVGEGEAIGLTIYDLRGREDVLEEQQKISGLLQRAIDLENGPLIRLGLFRRTDGDRLLIIIHHLCIDGVSWRILLEDLDRLLGQCRRRQRLSLPAKTLSYKGWSETMRRYADSEQLAEQWSYWKEVESVEEPLQDRKDPAERYNAGEMGVIWTKLGTEQTAELSGRVHQAYGTDVQDLLLTGFSMALERVLGQKRIKVFVEGHGRESVTGDLDTSRTVGWFTSLYPVVLDTAEQSGISQRIQIIKEAVRQVPDKGIGYGILRYLKDTDPGADSAAEVMFNYLGEFGAELKGEFFGISEEGVGALISPKAETETRLEITAIIVEKQLTLSVRYDRVTFAPEQMNELAESYRSAMEELIAFCCERPDRVFTPGDYSYRKLTAQQLEDLQGRYAIEDIYELTALQEGILFHWLYDRKSTSYYQQISYTGRGRLDIGALRESLREMIGRQEALRTAFVHKGLSRPVQVVLRERTEEFYFGDLRGLSDTHSRQQSVRRYKEEDRLRGFDLEEEMLLRLGVYQTGEEEYVFIWSHHHIIMDGWCISIVLEELSEIYNRRIQHRDSRLNPVVRYREYIVWLRSRSRAGMAYWSDYLRDYDKAAGIAGEKGGEHEREEKKEFRYELPEKISRGLEELAGRHRVTLHTLVEVLWGLLVSRHSNCNDVVFGSVVSGRPAELEGSERIVGLFVNAIPIRIRYDSEEEIGSLLKRVQEDALKMEGYQYVSLAEIQGNSSLKQDLLDHLLIFENYPISEGLKETGRGTLLKDVSELEIVEQTNYDLSVTVNPGIRLGFHFHYSGGKYPAERISLLGGQLQELASQILEDENRALGGLRIVSGEEESRILKVSNGTKESPERRTTIVSLFEEQVSRHGGRIAVVYGEEQVSYGELNRRSNVLAGKLRERGVGRESLVGVVVDRSVELVIGLLGILKAGGAYMPMDPQYPRERIGYMLSDSGAKWVLAGREYVDLVDAGCEVIDLSEEEWYAGEGMNLPESCSGSDLAYVIYTSGSTGKPKGVMIEHQSLANLCLWHQSEYRISKADRATVLASMSFDAFGWETFPYLSAGSTLTILA
jgi:non-ribosomal peptide synthase protein (TIGR01720 family)